MHLLCKIYFSMLLVQIDTIISIVHFSFLIFTFSKHEERRWTLLVVCEERKVIKKNWYLNEIKFRICNLGSVWIWLILLKLKTYCWNHCNKIIFKCVNSTVGPFFNEKINKKWNLWVREQCTNALFTKKSQHLRLLFIEQ